MKRILAIGTVVSLYNNYQKIMIIGYQQKELDKEKVWDYAACFYPEGFISARKVVLFDYDQIENIYQIGYQNQEQLTFSLNLEKKLNQGSE